MVVFKKAAGVVIGLLIIMAIYLIPLSIANRAGRKKEAAYWTWAMAHLDDKPLRQ